MKPVALSLILLTGLVPGRTEEMAAGLFVPQAETHVIGDEIPLVWIFTNQAAVPLAFMWEGCCRLNGRLSVTAPGRTVVLRPPGPSSAHQFPKAARINPGQPGQFTTLLSDWVGLTESGRYELQGTYVGILPNQNPQVPPSLKLWRGQTATGPLLLDVLDVDDYLAQRSERSQARQLQLTLTGPEKLTGTNRFQLRIHNRASRPQSLLWPQSIQLWLVDDQGGRASGVPQFLSGTGRTFTLPPDTADQLPVLLEARDLIGIPLGRYRLFLDLAAKDGQPRLPSNPVAVRWEVDQTDLAALLEQAVSQPGVGSRNWPLKLLRTYLEELGPLLNREISDRTDPRITQLSRQLALAACLKKIGPQPGRVDLRVGLAPEGLRFSEPTIRDCLPTNAIEQLSRILEVRRHLGWVVHVVVQPEMEASLGAVFEAAARLAHPELGGPPGALIPHPEAGAPVRLLFQPKASAANFILRIRRNELAVARRLPDPARPQLTALFSPEEQPAFETVDGAGQVEPLLQDGRLPDLRTAVWVAADVSWGELMQACKPLLKRSTQADLVLQ